MQNSRSTTKPNTKKILGAEGKHYGLILAVLLAVTIASHRTHTAAIIQKSNPTMPGTTRRRG